MMRSSKLLFIILHYSLLEASKYAFETDQNFPEEMETIEIVKMDSIADASSGTSKSNVEIRKCDEEYDSEEMECWESCDDYDEEFEECFVQDLQTIENSKVSSSTPIMDTVGSFIPRISPKIKMIGRRWGNVEIIDTREPQKEEQKMCIGLLAKNFVEMLKKKLIEAKSLKMNKKTAMVGAKTFIDNRSASLSEYKNDYITSHSNFDVVVYEHGWWMVWHKLLGEEGLLQFDDDFALYMSEIDESAIRKEICSQWKHSRWDVEKLIDTIAVDALRAFLYKTKKDITLSAIRSGLDMGVRNTLQICGWNVNDVFMVLISAYIVKFGFLQPIQDPMYSAAETLARGMYSTTKSKVVYVARNANNPQILAKNVKMNFKKIFVKVLVAPLIFKKRTKRKVKRKAVLNWIFQNFILAADVCPILLDSNDWHVLQVI